MAALDQLLGLPNLDSILTNTLWNHLADITNYSHLDIHNQLDSWMENQLYCNNDEFQPIFCLWLLVV